MDVRDHLHRPHSYNQFFNEVRDVAQKDLTGGSETLVQRMCTDCVKALAKEHIRSWINTYLRNGELTISARPIFSRFIFSTSDVASKAEGKDC